MQRKSTVALCVLAVAILLACSRNGPPSSLFEAAEYHVRDGKVYYLNAFPGKAFEINGADAATFQALDSTYGRARRAFTSTTHNSPEPTHRASNFSTAGLRHGPRPRLPLPSAC